jgi:hypothetical protein
MIPKSKACRADERGAGKAGAQGGAQRRAMDQMLELLAATLGDRPARVALGHCRAPDEAALIRRFRLDGAGGSQ